MQLKGKNHIETNGYLNSELADKVRSFVRSSLLELRTRIEIVADLYQTRKSAAFEMGVSEDMLRRYIKGENEPTVAAVARLAAPQGISMEWIATGRGDMFMTLEQISSGFGKFQESPAPYLLKSPMNEEYAAIPLYDVRAAAGGGFVVDSELVVDMLHFKKSWLRQRLSASPTDLHLIYVDGESMEPTLRPGEVILVDHRDTGPTRDGVYVLRMDGALMVKRLQRLPGGNINVTSDNTAYHPFTANVSQLNSNDFAIVGRVVWSARLH